MKIIETNKFKFAYVNYQTLPGFLPSRNIPNSSPQILFNDIQDFNSEEDIYDQWQRQFPRGTKQKNIYQKGIKFSVLDDDNTIPLIPV